jgi:hypothetical protein
MRGITRHLSYANVTASLALFIVLAGTALAGPGAITKSQVKKIAKKQANKQITVRAPGLSVARAVSADTATDAQNAQNANTVDGANASDLKTSSAFFQNGTFIADLGGSFVDVASATITTQGSGRILAAGSAELAGADTDEVGACRIEIDGSISLLYSSAPDDIGTSNQFVIAVNFAVTRPAGTYTARLRCFAAAGTISKDDAAISLYGLGS